MDIKKRPARNYPVGRFFYGKLLGVSHIRHTHLDVCSGHFQLVTICHRFKSLAYLIV